MAERRNGDILLADPVNPPRDLAVYSGDDSKPDISACVSSAGQDSKAKEDYCVGLHYYAIGNLAKAFEYLTWACKKEPDNPTYAAARAKAGMHIGERGLRAALDDILSVEPENGDVLHVRGLLDVHRREPARGLELLKRARALAPTDVEIRVSIAWALTALKRYDEARVEWDAILAKHELRPEWHFKYGRFLYDSGDSVKARRHFEIAATPRKLEPEAWQHWWTDAASAQLTLYRDAGRGLD